METIKVVNVKCSSCANTIKKELEFIGIKNIEVSFNESDSRESREIKFEGDKDKVVKTLSKLGYPEVGSEEAKSLLKKVKSFVSCVIGKTNL